LKKKLKAAFFIECSAKEGKNVKKVFEKVMKYFVKKNKKKI